MKNIKTGLISGGALVATLILAPGLALADGSHGSDGTSKAAPSFKSNSSPSGDMKNLMLSKMSGLSADVLAAQSKEPVIMPGIDEAIKGALEAAKKAALPMIDTQFHMNGKKITVPDDYKTIQAGIDAAQMGDRVVVKPGTYFELLVMKDGVKLVSDSANGGNDLVAVDGSYLKLPKRTLRTIIDGSKGAVSKHGMFDFVAGLGRKTIIDGFTIQNLPRQNHHIPGHAHAINIRGAKPVIINNIIQNNGSTGIGSHVIFNDQSTSIDQRDLRFANIKFHSSAVIYNNVIRGNFGVGIGSNHYTNHFVFGNEVYGNDDSEMGEASPGIGNKHGSTSTVLGNIVHDNTGGGIGCAKGEPQGGYGFDRRTSPKFVKNVSYNSGKLRSALGCSDAGSKDRPVQFIGNYIYNSPLSGISFTDGTIGIMKDNMVSGSRRAGILIKGSTALLLDGNKVTGTIEGAGLAIVARSVVKEMKGNASDKNKGPDFVSRGSKVGG